MNLDDEETRAKLLATLLQDALEGPTSRITKLDPKVLGARELPPGNWQQLYMLYVASCAADGTESASRATFYSVTLEWRKTLKFRHRSQHSVCGTCDQLKSRMRACKDFQSHAQAADQLLGHLTMTWKCRQAYWAARAASRSRQDLLCIIFDGYDKSKPMLPRWSQGRLPKIPVFERISRTHMAVSATLAHGWGCCVFLAEEGVSTGGSYSWEALFITMSMCWEAARQRGVSYPSSFLDFNLDAFFLRMINNSSNQNLIHALVAVVQGYGFNTIILSKSSRMVSAELSYHFFVVPTTTGRQPSAVFQLDTLTRT